MRSAFKELWATEKTDSPSSFLRPPTRMLVGSIIRSIISAMIIIGICAALTVDINVDNIIAVEDRIETIEVRSCFLVIDTSYPRDSTYVKVSSDPDTLFLTGTNTGLCTAKISIPPTRTAPLIIRATESTIVLSSSSNTSYSLDLSVIAHRFITGTIRVFIGGVSFNSLNIDTPSSLIVLEANQLLPSEININNDFGTVSVASPSSSSSVYQRISFEANVSYGGYCMSPEYSDLSYTITHVNHTDDDGNVTYVTSLVEGDLFSSASPTTTLKVNSSSFYLTRSTVEEKEAGYLMNQTQRLRPLVENYLLASGEFSDSQVNKMYVQAIEVVAPYAGALYLNSNSRFAIQFGPEFLTLLSGFQLSPSYRRMNSALSHYGCSNDTYIDAISAGIIVTPFDALDQDADSVSSREVEYLPRTTIRDLYLSIINLTADTSRLTAFSLISFDLSSKSHVVGHFKTLYVEDEEDDIWFCCCYRKKNNESDEKEKKNSNNKKKDKYYVDGNQNEDVGELGYDEEKVEDEQLMTMMSSPPPPLPATTTKIISSTAATNLSPAMSHQQQPNSSSRSRSVSTKRATSLTSSKRASPVVVTFAEDEGKQNKKRRNNSSVARKLDDEHQQQQGEPEENLEKFYDEVKNNKKLPHHHNHHSQVTIQPPPSSTSKVIVTSTSSSTQTPEEKKKQKEETK